MSTAVSNSGLSASSPDNGQDDSAPPPAGMEPDFLPPLPMRRYPEAVARLLSGGGGLASLTRALDDAGGYLVEDGPHAGSCTVTLARPVTAPDETAVAVFDTITHMHRRDLTPFILDRHDFDGFEVHASAFVLPRGLRASTGLLVGRDLDPHLGQDREAWRKACRRTEPLTTKREVLTVGGGRTTVITLPDALPQPFTEAPGRHGGVPGAKLTGGSRRGTLHSGRIVSRALGVELDAWCYLPRPDLGPPEAVIIICDGDVWMDGVELAPSLDRMHAAQACVATAAILFSPVDAALRPEVLGMHPRLPEFIESELLPWAHQWARLPDTADRRAVAGASLGGLAAADVVRRRPELVGNAVVQSGAFWWPADSQGEPTFAQLHLWRQATTNPRSPRIRIFQEVGSLEGHLLECNRHFRDVLRERGIEVAYREYIGGHDYACWRGGVIDAIIHFFPRPAT